MSARMATWLVVAMAAILMGPSASAWASPPDGITWTSRTSAADNQWTSVAYGNGLFVAVAHDGSGDRVMTSPDGITWTSRTSAANNSWQGVTYGNGLFVAVAFTGAGNRVMTSPDGITWTSRTSAADNQWKSVTYGNGLFVAVAHDGSGNRVMTSPDGITWTIRTSAADNNWDGVTYGNGLFVAVAWTGSGNRVMTSPDGITWTSRTSAADINWVEVAYGGGLFVAVADTGSGNRVMTSPDGITWTLRTSAADNNWYGVTYGGGLFVAVANTGSGNRVMTSPDGITWTLRTSAANNQWLGVTYGGGLFVAVANTGSGNRVMTNGTFDTTAPNTPSITAGPADGSVTSNAAPSFDFTATDNAGGTGVASYQCRLDTPGATGAWSACTSPRSYATTGDGAYTFHVRAIDHVASTGAATSRSWTVDTAAPALTVDRPPPANATGASTTIEFSSADPAATFRCRVDGGAYTPCTSPHTITGLADGAHTIDVLATDPAGNTSPAASWTITTTTPVLPPAINPVTPTTTPPAGRARAAILTRSARLDRKGRVKLKVRCTGGPCEGQLTLTQKAPRKKTAGKAKKARTITLGTAKLTLPAGRTKTISIRLNATGRKLLRQSRRATKARARIQLGPRTPRQAAVTRTITLAPYTAPRATKRR